MPKIPTYNSKIGPATGKLSPELSLQPAQQMAQAYSGLGKAVGQVADVAASFERRLQLEEVQKVADEYSTSMRESYRQLNTQEYSSVSEYDAAERTLRQGMMDGISQMESLSPFQKRNLKDKTQKTASVYSTDGRKAAYDRFVGAKGQTNDKSIDGLVDEAISGTLPFGVALAEAESRWDYAQLQGYPSKYKDKEALRYSMLSKNLDVRVNQKGVSVENMLAEKDQIMAREGIYAGLELGEAEGLASIIENKIDYMEGGLVVELETQEADAITMAMDGDPAWLDLMDDTAEAYRLLNRPADQKRVETNRDTIGYVATLFNGSSKLDFASPESIAEMPEVIRKRYADQPALANAAVKLFAEQSLARDEQLQNNPVGYLTKRYQSRYDRDPNIQELVDLQRKVGISESKISFATQAKMDEYTNELTTAESVVDVMRTMQTIKDETGFGLVMDSRKRADMEELINRNLYQQGIPMQLSFVAQRPESAFSSKLLNSVSFNPEKVGFTDGHLTKIRQAVIADETMKSQLSSMDDSPKGQPARQQHINMMVKMVAQDIYKTGEPFTESGYNFGASVSSITAMYDERYNYKEYGDYATLRLPNSFTPESVSRIHNALDEKAKEIVSSAEFPESIFSGQSRAAEAVYRQNLNEEYGWTTTRSDKAARLVDSTGAPVEIMAFNEDEELVRTFIEIPFSELALVVAEPSVVVSKTGASRAEEGAAAIFETTEKRERRTEEKRVGTVKKGQ